jgi:predicted Zn-dependent protease
MTGHGVRALRAAVGLVMLGVAGCIPLGPGYDPIDAVAPSFSDDDEREIGLAFDHSLVDSGRVVLDPVVTGFLQRLGQSIVDETGEQPFVYRFRVIEDPSLNAFAVFGGYIYVHTGTLLAVSDLAELAGVMGHEVAHVRLGHHARIEQKTALPNLLANLAGLGATLGTGEIGGLVTAQAINVALQLHWSRELEAEADYYGTEFAARAGYEPAGIRRFFERILAARGAEPDAIPPYLYSHPAVDERIEAVTLRASALEPGPRADPGLEAAFAAARERLLLLRASNRTHWIEQRPPNDLFSEEEAVATADPAVPFRRGEALLAAGDAAGAALAFRDTIRLDPTRALVFFRLGEAFEALGERTWAVWAYEHALFRAGKKSTLHRRAEWEVVKLTFPVVHDVSLRAERLLEGGDAETLFSGEWDRAGSTRLVWRARLGKRFEGLGARLRTRWSGPGIAGAIEVPVVQPADDVATASLALEAGTPGGPWTVTLELDGDVVDERSLEASAVSGS